MGGTANETLVGEGGGGGSELLVGDSGDIGACVENTGIELLVGEWGLAEGGAKKLAFLGDDEVGRPSRAGSSRREELRGKRGFAKKPRKRCYRREKKGIVCVNLEHRPFAHCKVFVCHNFTVSVTMTQQLHKQFFTLLFLFSRHYRLLQTRQ